MDFQTIALVFFVEGFLHYFRWREILKGHELPRPVAYILGVLGLMVPYSAWLIRRGSVQEVIMLWAVIVGGGLSVLSCYGIDAVSDLYWGKRHAEQREHLAEETHHA